MKSTTKSQVKMNEDKNYHQEKKREILISNLLVAGVITLICFFLFWRTGLLHSGLNIFMNDNKIFIMDQQVQQIGLWETIRQWLVRDHNMGRFVPLYYINQILLTQLLGINANVWFTFSCLLLSMTAFAMFWFARLLNISLLIACIFPALALVGPQASIWTQPSYTQVTGTFFLAISMVFAVLFAKSKSKNQALILNILLVLSALCASLIKESYIICIPALIALRIWSYGYLNRTEFYESVLKTLKTNIILLVVLIIQLSYIFFIIGSDGMKYAGVDQQTFQLVKILNTALDFSKSSHFWIFPSSVLATFLVLSYRKQSIISFIKKLLPCIVISFLIIAPQILLYTKSGILVLFGYYLIPATIGSALLITYSLEILKSSSKFIGYIFISISIAAIVSSISTVWTTYNTIAYHNSTINRLFEEITKCTPNNESILIVANPRVRNEAIRVTPKILDHAYDRQNLVIATYGLKDAEFFSNTLQETESQLMFLNPQKIQHMLDEYDYPKITYFEDKKKISAVVIFDGLDNDFLQTSNTWFDLDNYEKSEFPFTFAPANLYCKYKS